MQASGTRRRIDRPLLLKLALLAVVLAAGGALLLLGFDWRGAIAWCLDWVRNAGPLAFFTAMAVLPAFGFPLSPFTLGAGPAFGPVYGLPVVILATCLALFVNVLLSYVLARWLLRPWLERLVVRLGYRLPEVSAENYWDIALLLRVTPGPPFFLQSYLLGLARVPLRIYLICSLAVAWGYSIALVMFGDALLEGRGKMVLFALTLLVAAGTATHLVRRHFARKKAAALAGVLGNEPQL